MAPNLIQSSEYLRTAGMKANNDREYSVTLYGKSYYYLLEILEGGAERSAEFTELLPMVFLAVEIRSQLREQGF
jgi:hypothetical protein